MIFNEDFQKDIVNICDYIQSFARSVGLKEVAISSIEFIESYEKLRFEPASFPCKGGVVESSVFKKAAAFIICFMKSGMLSDHTVFKNSTLSEWLKEKNPNAIIALDIALDFIVGSVIHRNDGSDVVVKNCIQLSRHSYCDFVDMLTKTTLSMGGCEGHFMMMSLLLEQLTYKTNWDLQYDDLQKYGSLGTDLHDIPKLYAPEENDLNNNWDDRGKDGVSYDQPGYSSVENNPNY